MSATETIQELENGAWNDQELAIELVGVTKRYGEIVALHDISLDIIKGEFLVLLGPSGCGKSTILKIISGLEDASDGEVYINGKLINYTAPKDRDVAMVFQNYALYPHMTVERNIGFPLQMQGVPKSDRRKQVVDVARLLEVDDLLEKYPGQLSGGQRQRVALGRALIRDPFAFLLDEPLSNLDALLRVQMRDELMQLHNRIGRTNIYVTHDQVEAMTMANRIVVLKRGVIQQIGSPQEVYRRPKNTFVATFVGSPQMNLIPGHIVSGEDGLKFVGPFDFPLHKKFAPWQGELQVSIGFRPEAISVTRHNQENLLQGSVVLVEPIGSDIFLNISVGADAVLKVRVPASFRVQIGDLVFLGIEADEIHLFDANGLRIEAEQGD